MSLLLYLWNDLPTCCFADSLIFKVAILLGIGLDSAGAWELQLTLQNSGSCRLYFVESTKTLREGFCTLKITNTNNGPRAYPLCNHKASTFWVSHFLHLPSADKGNEGLTLGRANKWGLCVWGNRSFLKIGRSMWLREKYGGKHCPRGTRTRISRERTRCSKRVKLDSCSTCVTKASTANSATHLSLSIPLKNITQSNLCSNHCIIE